MELFLAHLNYFFCLFGLFFFCLFGLFFAYLDYFFAHLNYFSAHLNYFLAHASKLSGLTFTGKTPGKAGFPSYSTYLYG